MHEHKLPRNRPLRVYIAGQLSGKETKYISNCARMFRAARDVMDMGHCPLCPAVDFLFGISRVEEIPVAVYKRCSLEWVACCDVLLRLEGESNGAEEEVRLAKVHGLLIIADPDQLPYRAPESTHEH